MTVVVRESKETRVRVALTSGTGESRIDTTVSFLDHMLVTLARYAGFDLDVQATGDLRHHLIEDVAIALGTALADFAPATCVRYADRTIAMDDALVHVALDCGSRAFYAGRLPAPLYDHFFRSLADNARVTVHVRVLRGTDRHHVVEAAFKALGLSLGDAFVESGAVFSTKGTVRLDLSGE
jgi:imidazoleglycerol-phosphate dehydratase